MLVSRCFLHLTLFIIAQCKIPYLDTGKIDTNGLRSFMKNLMKESRLTSLIVFDKNRTSMDEFYRQMFEDFYVPIKKIRTENTVPIIQSNVCVLLLDGLHGIESTLNKYESDFWNTGNFYVLRYIAETEFSLGDEILYVSFHAALERLWRLRRIYKVVISIGDKYVYYDPFEPSDKAVVNEMRSDRSMLENDSSEFGALRISTQLRIDTFVSRRDFNGYKLAVSTFEYVTMTKMEEGYGYVGSDRKAMTEICKMMNVSPMCQDSSESTFNTTDDTFTNTLRQLIRHTSDVGFNGFFIKDYDINLFEFTGYVTSDSVCVVVPKRGAIPNYLAIVRVFSAETWLLIIVTHIIVSVIYLRNRMIFGADREKGFSGVLRNTGYSGLIMKKNGRINRSSKAFGNFRKTYGNEVMGFFDAHLDVKGTHGNCCRGDQRNRGKWNWSKAYDSPDIKNPKKSFGRVFLMHPKAQLNVDHPTSFIWKVLLSSIQPLEMAGDRVSERVVLVCSLLLGVVLGGSFTSQLTSSYSKPAFYKNIETLKELEKSGMEILTNFKNLQTDVFANDDTAVLSNLQAKLYLVNTTEMHYRAYVMGNAGVLERKKFLPFSIFGSYRMHVVNECPKKYILAFVVTKGSVFLPRINEIIGRIQNGLSCSTIIFFCERKGYV
ncbi:uncharacterized protein LOC107264037 isoform X2 [Cephus cinctus]|uniref:Uncharacterized protein LOC107264037 isoform X2 n=1 Tax=Cephus cinctus TaxID=211228 RepID=A0AAJ7R8X0_CEPCN|nr:uncharacterized protein LOC107264037 isoform X2 [Cephus cinctus]